MRLSTLVRALLPHLHGLRLEHVLVEAGGLILTLSPTRQTASCPLCRRRSRRVHSHYRRTLADLPWGGRAVTLRLQVRRFRCANRRCPRRIFAERLPSLAAPHARRTQAQAALLLAVACAMGGQPGARLAGRFGAAASRATLLRLLRQAPLPSSATPRILGVDDWSQRRGQVYGTILVDAERRRPIDLLPDRTADSLAAWLAAHPGVEVLTRDRSGAYADGAARAAPRAVQVADRFHVIDDLGDALEQVLAGHRSALRELALPTPLAVIGGEPSLRPETGAESTPGVGRRMPHAQRLRQQRRARRLDRYERLEALKRQGWTIGAIARELGISRRTIERWNRADGFPERKPRRRPLSPLAPFAEYLTQRWAEGCHTGVQLWREVCARGYDGSQKAIWPVLHRLRQGLPAIGVTDPPPRWRPVRRPPSPRRMAGIVLRRPAERTPAEQQALTRLVELRPAIGSAVALAERFTTLVRERCPEALEQWLADADASGLPSLRSLAAGLGRDKAAVLAAVALPYSNGQTEGQITKLKLLKRSMYGRASFQLLRRRVLLAA